MADHGIPKGCVVYSGRKRASLGGGVWELPADDLLAQVGRLP